MEDNIQITTIDTIEAQEKAAYDIQIATAKKYPRDIERAAKNALVTATMSKEVAESCGYSVPRGKDPITGPSVHLAKIIAQNWGNMRIESKVTDISQTQITSTAVCFDLETNIAVKVEVKRKITNKHGVRFNEDMITVTGNAANSIALRNAVFSVVPESITQSIYEATKKMLKEGISSDDELAKTRDSWIAFYRNSYRATDAEIIKMVGAKSIEEMTKDQVLLMQSTYQSIKDGDTDFDTALGRKSKPTPSQKKEDLKNNKQNKPKVDLP